MDDFTLSLARITWWVRGEEGVGEERVEKM